MLKKFLLKTLLITVLASFFTACSDNDDTKLSQTARLTVRLTDAPGDYEAVNIDVQDVMINASDDPEAGWQSLEGVNTGVYDLLELTGGLNVLLADNQIPAGKLNQIRLVLGEENTVVIDGTPMHLDTPSALQSGLKIQVNEILEAGYTYDIVLDFDVDASIVEAGNSGNKNLKPVIRASAIATSGIIEGSVEPAGFDVKVSVVGQGINAYTDESGVFMLYGVPAGTYDLEVSPDPAQGYANVVETAVEVTNGQTTVLTPILLPELGEGKVNVFGKVMHGDTSYNEFTATLSMGEGEEMIVYEATYSADGGFTFYNIDEGTYTLEIMSTDEEAEITGVTETIEVSAAEGNFKDLGVVEL